MMRKDVDNATREARAIREKLGLITEAELFALLNITEGTGKNRQSAGKLPPRYKSGRENFYRLVEVDAWLKRQRVARVAA